MKSISISLLLLGIALGAGKLHEVVPPEQEFVQGLLLLVALVASLWLACRIVSTIIPRERSTIDQI